MKPLENKRSVAIICTLMLMCSFCAAQASPEGLIDFDSVVPFETPRFVSIYRSADTTKTIFFVLPTSLLIDNDAAGKPRFGLLHYGIVKKNKLGRGGRLVVTFRPELDPSVRAILPELQKKYPNATFVVPTPSSSKIIFLISSNLGGEELQESVDSSSLNGPFTVNVHLTEPGARALLSPASEKADVFAARYEFTLRGVVHGSPAPLTRTFSISLGFSGMCVAHPELFEELRTQRLGCVVRKKHWWE